VVKAVFQGTKPL